MLNIDFSNGSLRESQAIFDLSVYKIQFELSDQLAGNLYCLIQNPGGK